MRKGDKVRNIVAAMAEYDANRPVRKRRGVDYRLAWDIKKRMEEDFTGLIGKPRVKYIREGGKERRLQVPSYVSCVAQIALWHRTMRCFDRMRRGDCAAFISMASRRGRLQFVNREYSPCFCTEKGYLW